MRVRFRKEMFLCPSLRCLFLRLFPSFTDFCFAVAANVKVEATGCSSSSERSTSTSNLGFVRQMSGDCYDPVQPRTVVAFVGPLEPSPTRVGGLGQESWRNVYRARDGGRDEKGRLRSMLRSWRNPATDGHSVDETEQEKSIPRDRHIR